MPSKRFLSFLCSLSLSVIPVAQDNPRISVVPDSCPVTKSADHSFIPPAPYRAKPSPDMFWFGTDKLWTELWVTGTWSGLPHYTPTRQTYYREKLIFWRQGYDPHSEPHPNLTVTGRRIDGQAPPLQTDGKGNGSWTNDDQFIMTGINFPTLGCWEITGHYENKELNESDQLTFVIWVAPPIGSGVSSTFDRRQYMNAEDGVTFARALEVPDPGYPEKVRRRCIQGNVVLAIAINKNGQIDEVKIIQRLDPDLDQAAVDAVKRWRFAPAEKDGAAVPSQAQVEMSFRLPSQYCK
ncbi:MAG TPA: energy transducer TonB [Terriglobales bacterium]